MSTGFLQLGAIDEKDKAHWLFDERGVINGADGFVLNGTSGTCWVMVHGYSSTPDELRIAAQAVHYTFNDTIYVPLLYGHGMVPSELEMYSVVDWYGQVAGIMREHNCAYMLGSSMGASLTLRYAEDFGNVSAVIVGVPLVYQPSYLPVNLITRVLYPIVRYSKRKEPGQTVDDPLGNAAHITGYSFPMKGVVELADFNNGVTIGLNRIHDPVLILHAQNDTVASIDGAYSIYNQIHSRKKFVNLAGDHIVFRDYGKEKAIEEVLEFRWNHTK